MTTSDIFSLESIRSTLIRQEETIIFALIERAQFRRNHAVYEIGDEFGGNALMNDDDHAYDDENACVICHHEALGPQLLKPKLCYYPSA